MATRKPKSRTGASKPAQTRHLNETAKRALDIQAEAEHADGLEREKLIRKSAHK